MSKKHKWVKLGTKGLVAGAFIATAPIIALPIAKASGGNASAIRHSSNITANETYDYVPINIKSGYNCSTIIADSGEDSSTAGVLPNIYNISPLDYPSTDSLKTILPSYGYEGTSRSALFLTDTAKAAAKAGIGSYTKTPKGFDNPSNGYVTLTSINQPTGASTGYPLKWNIPVNTTLTVNNGMKLIDTDDTARTGSFTFSDLGVYDKMYALCIVSNVPDNHESTPVDVQMRISYTTGDPSDWITYHLYDWFFKYTDDKLIASNGSNINRCLIGVKSATNGAMVLNKDKTYWDNGQSSTNVIMNQCAITVDTDRIVKSLDIKMVHPTEYTSSEVVTVTVLGVTGQVLADVLAPVTIKTQKTEEGEKKTNYVTWEDSDPTKFIPSFYYLDVYYYDDDGNVVWSDYNNTEISREEAEKTLTEGKFRWPIEGLLSDKKYYVKMRAGNAAKRQSVNSNIDYIYTDTGCPLTVECSINTNETNTAAHSAKVAESFQVKTVVTNNQASPSPCADQNINWEIPADYKEWISYDENAATKGKEKQGYKLWDFVTKKPFKDQVITAKAHADLQYKDTVTVNSAPNSPTGLSAPTIENHGATISWTNPEISESDPTKHKFHLIVKNSTTSAEVYNGYVDFNQSTNGSTSKAITGLTAKTGYTAEVKTVYSETWSGTTPSDPIDSGTPVKLDFTTAWNEANSLVLSPTQITLSLGKTNTTKSIQTTVKDANGNKGTYQAVTITPSTGADTYAKHDEPEFKEETATTFKFEPLKASSGFETWTISVDEKTSITQALQVKVNVDPTTALDATNPTPTGFTANWEAAQRADGTYWADSYVIVVTNETTKAQVKEITISDKTQTSCPITGLDQSNKNWSYSVYAVNNGVKSTASTKTVTTANSLPTKVVVKDETSKEIKSMETLELLVGTEKTLTTNVIGQTFDSVTYAADDQKVVKSVADGEQEITVSDTSDDTHVLKVTNDAKGTTAFWLIANSKGPDNTEISTKILVDPIHLNLHGASNIGPNSFTLTWDDLSSYSTNLKYVFDVSTDKTFTDETKFVLKGEELTAEKTQLVVSGLDKNTTYYYRGKYVNNSLSSEYREGSVLTTDSINTFTLNKSAITIFGNDTDTTLEGTSISSYEDLDVEWELSDDSICDVSEIDFETNDEYTKQYRFQITGKTVGTTVLKVHPKDFPDIVAQCTINVVKGIMDPVHAWAENIQSHSFELLWDKGADWGGAPVNYKVNVWYEVDGKKKYIFRDFLTCDTKLLLDPSIGVVTNQKYYCTVEAWNKHYQTNEYNIVEVTLTDNSWPLWKIIAVSTGSTIGGWLLISYILYIFWKKSWLKTYDQKKVKDKVKGKKVKTHDKYFRVIDKACVTTNKKVTKRSNSLMTRFGTKNEQDEKYKK